MLSLIWFWYQASSRNLFENLQKLCINVELTDVSHVIALCYVLRHCVHIRVLQLEVTFSYFFHTHDHWWVVLTICVNVFRLNNILLGQKWKIFKFVMSWVRLLFKMGCNWLFLRWPWDSDSEWFRGKASWIELCEPSDNKSTQAPEDDNSL